MAVIKLGAVVRAAIGVVERVGGLLWCFGQIGVRCQVTQVRLGRDAGGQCHGQYGHCSENLVHGVPSM